MKTVNIYEVGETVLVKAKVSNVYIDKDRVSYTLVDENNVPYKNRFTSRDIVSVPEEKDSED